MYIPRSIIHDKLKKRIASCTICASNDLARNICSICYTAYCDSCAASTQSPPNPPSVCISCALAITHTMHRYGATCRQCEGSVPDPLAKNAVSICISCGDLLCFDCIDASPYQTCDICTATIKRYRLEQPAEIKAKRRNKHRYMIVAAASQQHHISTGND